MNKLLNQNPLFLAVDIDILPATPEALPAKRVPFSLFPFLSPSLHQAAFFILLVNIQDGTVPPC